MKFRNLFLATVACAGLFTACSNEMNEGTDNETINGQKDAFMQIGFTFPETSSLSRAADNTEVGDKTEQSFKEILLVIADKDNKITDAETISAEKFAPEGATGGQPGDGNTKYYVSAKAIPVTKQDGAKVYVFVNPTAAIAAQFKVEYVITGKEELPIATEQTGGLANAGEFFMTNMTNESNISAVSANIAGTKSVPTKVKVAVNRVSAKLVENTAKTSHDIEGLYENDKSEKYKLTIKLDKYTYTNLNKTSYVFEQKLDGYTKDLNFDTDAANGAFFFQNALTAKAEGDYKFQGMQAGKIDYCLENTVTAVKQYTNNTTGIIYRAIATWNSNTTAATFYSYLGKIHLTWESLKTKYDAGHTGSELTAKDDYSIEALAAKGVTKYADGVCYYRTSIKHIPSNNNLAPMEFAIVRNNVYKLNVNSINSLGEPTIPTEPDPDETDKASIELTVEVLPWTVRDNNFDF